MHKNKLIKNTFYLILGGLITKILGFIIKILYTRYLKAEGVSLISLIFPTYSLLLTITSLSLPLAITKLTAENKERKSKILYNAILITIIINILIISIGFIFSNYYSATLLHDKRCALFIRILCLTLPFVSITSLIKAYFFGKENVIPIIFSNISEEILKMILIMLFLPSMVKKSIILGISFYLTVNLLCEIISFFTLYIFLPKKVNFKKLDCKYNQNILNRLLKISIPTLSGRIIGNIGFFFEPIILTNLLIYKGLDSSLIRLSYGYFQGYVIAILTIPSFFLMALSSNTIPVISKYKTHKEFNKIKKTINKVLLTVLFCGTIFIIFLSIYGKNLMYILYKTTSGYNYLKMLLPFFIIFYIENPMLSILQSLDMEKKVFKITTCGIIIKYISLILLILFNKGFNSLIYSEIINIIFVISLSVYYLKKYFSCSSQ